MLSEIMAPIWEYVNSNILEVLAILAAALGLFVAVLQLSQIRYKVAELKKVTSDLEFALEQAAKKGIRAQEGLTQNRSLRSLRAAGKKHIFISYSYQDIEFADRLAKNLDVALKKYGMSTWMDRSLIDGSPFTDEIEKALDSSVLVVALTSPNFLASNYVHGKELPEILKRYENGVVDLTWIPVETSAVEQTELVNVRSLISPKFPLETQSKSEQTKSFVSITNQISAYLESAGSQEKSLPHANRIDDTKQAIRLKTVKLKNISCMEDLLIDLTVESEFDSSKLPSLRSVIVGDNAMGKSTILRSISIALSDEVGASKLVSELEGSVIRKGENEASIELRFCSDDGETQSRCTTTITRKTDSEEQVRQTGKPPTNFMIVGYGTQRSRMGTKSYDKYEVSDAVCTLFDGSSTLQNPELAILRQPQWERDETIKLLSEILELNRSNIKLDESGITVSGTWGRERIETLSDGYRSTIQWVLDFIGWLSLYRNHDHKNDGISILILVDEIEQHLHPQWQRRIISNLREKLPGVQFLVTSHSPLIASSVTGISEDGWREKLLYLKRDESCKISIEQVPSLVGFSVQQALASPAFDYLIQADPSVEKVYREASRLASKGRKRSIEEEERYLRVKKIISEMADGDAVTLIEQHVSRDLVMKSQEKLAELERILFEYNS